MFSFRGFLFSISSALLLPLSLAVGSNDIGTAPDRGYLLEVGTPTGIPQSVGESARIEGKILLGGNGRHSGGDCIVSVNGSAGKGEKGDRKSKTKTCDILTELRDGGVTVRAYFPDLTTEVSSQISVQSMETYGAFRFDTPPLSFPGLNTFVIQLARQSHSGRALEVVKSKLDRRVLGLRIGFNEAKNKGASAEELAQLSKVMDKLLAMSDKIEQKLATRDEILAEYRLPLQVGNALAAEGASSTLMGKHRLAVLSSPIGSAIEGGRTTLKGTVSSAQNPDDESDDNSEELKIARFYWNGVKVREVGPQKIEPGSDVSFSLETGRLNSEDPNIFTVALYKWSPESGGGLGKRIGEISHRLPVAADNESPKWMPGNILGEGPAYFQEAPSISAEVRDPFGLIDNCDV